MKYLFFCSVFVFSIFSADVVIAAEGGYDWTNFTYRIINFFLVLGILYYAFAKKVRDFFVKRRASLIEDFASLKKSREDALMKLSQLEDSMDKVKEEQENIAKEQYEKTEILCRSIIEEANSAAEQIIAHAEKMAQNEILECKRKLLEEMSEQIVVDVQERVSHSLSGEEYLAFLRKSLDKVVYDAK
ncbi:MAG: ATP synthase F0 subunit B [Desulfovibrionaceae bacterium]